MEAITLYPVPVMHWEFPRERSREAALKELLTNERIDDSHIVHITILQYYNSNTTIISHYYELWCNDILLLLSENEKSGV